MKNAVFTGLNLVLPPQGVMPMHCSANIGADGDTAIFFGLSGTGKTTLSADASRTPIGDDEHGWSGTALLKFEGGCHPRCSDCPQSRKPRAMRRRGVLGRSSRQSLCTPPVGRLTLGRGW